MFVSRSLVGHPRSAAKRRPTLVSVCAAKSLVLTAALIWSIAPAKAEYRLHAGDVIEISVAGLPDLKQRVPVQIDGTISYPLLGTIAVSGLPPAKMQAEVQAVLATKAFNQRTSDGRENVVAITPDSVTATVVEYGPIYIDGDVSKPGALPYRPLMTVRQAVALSGGVDVVHLRSDPVLEAADSRAEYASLWTEFAKQQAQVWRLQQELGEQATLDEKKLLDLPIAPSTANAIVKIEAENLKTRQDDKQAEMTFLQRGISQADQEIQVLSDQRKAEEAGAQADADDFARVQDLFNRGNAAALRVSDARRAMLLSETRKLQTMAQLMQTQRQRDDLIRQVARLDSKQRSDLLGQLQDATVELSKIRFKLQSTGEKLQYAALARSQLVRDLGSKLAITVIRRDGSGTSKLTADQDFELQPGDVVEVALRQASSAAPGAPAGDD
jgi:polysaccharide biosynthesis/export protein